MATWVPAHPKVAYSSPQHALQYSRIYVATVDERLANNVTLRKGFSTSYAPKARPRLFVVPEGIQTNVAMSYWETADQGTIYTTGLDSCVAIAVAAFDASKQQYTKVAMAHLTGSYYPGGKGPMYTDGDWDKLFNAMPDDIPNGQLYAVVAGSSHRGGWDPSNSIMGGDHRPGNPSNPDEIWNDLAPKHIPKRNFLFYTLAPGICNGMTFGIRLRDGMIGEV